MFNNNRDDFAPRSAAIFRGLLDEAGIRGGRDRAPGDRADPVLTLGAAERRPSPAEADRAT